MIILKPIMRRLIYLFALAAGFGLLTGCGGNNTENQTATGNGSLSFRIVYQGAGERSYTKDAVIDCVGLEINEVEAVVYNTDGFSIARGGPWPCEDGEGTIDAVPAGNDRTVVILGKDTSDNVVFRGEQSGIDVQADIANNVGTIDFTDFVPRLMAPADQSRVTADAVEFVWNDIDGASEYRVIFSENSDLSDPCIRDTTVNENYPPEDLSVGKTYYWQVAASDAYGNTSIESPLRSFSVIADYSDGQLVLYTFSEGSGAQINDYSGIGMPLNLLIDDESAISWIDGGGLAINQPTVIRSMGIADKIIDVVALTNSITIEAWVKPRRTNLRGPARIVSLSGDNSVRNFTLGQQIDTYVVRLRTTETSLQGTDPYIYTTDGSLTTELTHVVYTRDESGDCRVYINGVLAEFYLKYDNEDAVLVSSGNVGGDLTNWDDFFFLLANEETEDRAWLGEIYLVAIFDHALDQDQIIQNYEAGY